MRDPFVVTDGSVAATVGYVRECIAARLERIERMERQGNGLARSADRLRKEITGLEALIQRTESREVAP